MARKPAFISHSRDREAEIQGRLLDVLERRFRRQLRDEIRRESGRIASAYTAGGFVPPVSDQHQRRVRDIYFQLALASARTFGKRVTTQAKAAGFDLETKQDDFWSRLFQSLAHAWINAEAIRRRIVSVSETTREQIVSIVAQGQADGLGVDAIARNIRDRVDGISTWRGALIARTETHGAANFAMHRTAQESGLDLEKEWVAAKDHRTRRFSANDQFDHLAMDGQRVAMDDPFLMPWAGGPPLPVMYPGQEGLPGGAVINCRCAVVHHVKSQFF